MRLSYPLGNGQSQSAAGQIPSLPEVGLIETVEDMPANLLRHPNTIVADGQEYPRLRPAAFNKNLTVLRRIFDRIIQKNSR